MANHPYHHHDQGGEQRQDFRGVGPKNYKRSDQRIYEDVCERLTQHGQIDATHIQVDVNDGEVTLHGTVNDRQAKRMAEDVATDVSGVQDVHNELKVQSEQGQRPQAQFSSDRQRNQSGMPGGGKGRVDRVGRSGVYPASGPWPKGDAEVQGEMGWGQGERGEEGYYDSGRSSVESEVESERNKNINRHKDR